MAGGYTGQHEYTVTTEVLVDGADVWEQVGDLPTVPNVGLRGVSFNNRILMTGRKSVISII